MADFPSMPLFTDAYLADTRHLSTLEHGAYLLLLMEAWRRPTCSLPNDPSLLARLAGVSVDEWKSISPAILEFWDVVKSGKEIAQKRLRKERDFVAKKRAKNRDIAVSGWKQRKSDHANALPEGMPKRCQNDAPTPTPTIKENNSLSGVIKETKKNAGLDEFKAILSPVMRADILDDLIKHRRMKKAAFSATSAKMVLAAADKCRMTPDKAAVTMIERNWITIKPEWLNKNQQQATTVSALAGQMVRERYENENQRCEFEQPDLLSGNDPERFDINVLITGSKAP